MLERIALPTPVRDKMQLDLRPLHSALAHASNALDMLDVCQATTMMLGADIWLAAHLLPEARTVVCASVPVPDAAILQALDEMQATARAGAVPEGAAFCRSAVCRWRDPASEAPGLAPDYAQVEMSDGGQLKGLLRVGRLLSQDLPPCDWDAVEEAMCVAAPYLLLCQARDTREARVDPITGLYTTTEFRARVEREVDLARARPVELALVMLEIRTSADRVLGALTEAELRAIGQVVRQTLRDADSASRMPNGRFALLLPMTSQRHALIAASRVVDRLQAHPALPSGLTCQMGVSGWTFEGPTAPELFGQAQQALDEARTAGARGAFLFI